MLTRLTETGRALLTAIRFAIAALAVRPLVWRSPDRRPSPPGLVLYAFMGLCLAGLDSYCRPINKA